MKQIRFIHCADLHLGTPFVGIRHLPQRIYEEIRSATERSFTKIVDLAIEKRVDFMIIAGDLYDGEDRNIRAQLFFRRQMERLGKEQIPVFVVHGNHDHLGGNWTKLKWPDNVHIFPEQVTKKRYITSKGVVCHLYGFSYPKAHVGEKMIGHYQKEQGADFHIGILHGHDSNDVLHDPYAPFTIQELKEKEFDYWALGHIHRRQILAKEPLIIYPGNIQGRNKKETGDKGCYFVTLTETGTEAEFIATAPVIWEQVELKNPVKSFDNLYEECLAIKERMKQRGKHTLLEITANREFLHPDVEPWFHSEELLEILQEGEEAEPVFAWIYSFGIVETFQAAAVANDHFFQEMEKVFSELQGLSEPLAPLYTHPRARKFLDTLTKREELEIMDRARQLLYWYLQGQEGDDRVH